MSGKNVEILVKRRLKISHKIEIDLTDLETQEIDKELGETDCPKVCGLIDRMTDEELYALFLKIKKKKKMEKEAIAGVC